MSAWKKQRKERGKKDVIGGRKQVGGILYVGGFLPDSVYLLPPNLAVHTYTSCGVGGASGRCKTIKKVYFRRVPVPLL